MLNLLVALVVRHQRPPRWGGLGGDGKMECATSAPSGVLAYSGPCGPQVTATNRGDRASSSCRCRGYRPLTRE